MKTIIACLLLLFAINATAASWWLERIDAPQAWQVSDGTGVKVGVVNDANSHATIVTNAIKSVAPGATIVRYWGRGKNTFKATVDGIKLAADGGAKVINVSMVPSTNRKVLQAADYARSKGALVVWSGGNFTRTVTPVASIVHTGATDQNDMVPSWSNSGPHIDVCAPGVGVVGYSGNSLSAAVVSGVAALAKGAHPSYTPAQLESKLEHTAVDLGPPGKDIFYGWGLVNALAAVQ